VVIPIIPGVPMIGAGMAMLGARHPLVRSVRTWLLQAKTFVRSFAKR
jgi:hypothetical protein